MSYSVETKLLVENNIQVFKQLNQDMLDHDSNQHMFESCDHG